MFIASLHSDTTAVILGIQCANDLLIIGNECLEPVLAIGQPVAAVVIEVNVAQIPDELELTDEVIRQHGVPLGDQEIAPKEYGA